MKQVILPTDFSENAWKAMSYAANIHHNQPVSFHLLTCISPPVYQIDNGLAVDIQALLKEAEKDLKKTLKKFADLDHHDKTKFTVKAKLGNVLDAIENILSPLSTSETSVVIGSHGNGTLFQNLFGTTASAIIEKCTTSVYCVPSNATLETPKNILLALDSHPEAINNKLAHIALLAQEFQSSIHVVNVSNIIPHYQINSPEWIICEHHFKILDHSYHSIKDESLKKGLLKFTSSQSIDLIIMIKTKKGLFDQLFKKSNTKEIVFHGDKPLLVIK